MSDKTKEELKAMAKQLAELNEGFAQLAEGDEEKEMSFGQAANQFAQGLLFNTSDEIKAGLRSVFGDKTYDEAVEEGTKLEDEIEAVGNPSGDRDHDIWN